MANTAAERSEGIIMRETVLHILLELKPAVNFRETEHLLASGALDSFDVIILISELRDAFDIIFAPQDLTPENFDSIDSIVAMITEKKAN